MVYEFIKSILWKIENSNIKPLNLILDKIIEYKQKVCYDIYNKIKKKGGEKLCFSWN